MSQQQQQQHLIDQIKKSNAKSDIVKLKDVSMYRVPTYPGSPHYRPTRCFINLMSSAGTDIPNVNHPNFHKAIEWIEELEENYPGFDEEPFREAKYRSVNWNDVMNVSPTS